MQIVYPTRKYKAKMIVFELKKKNLVRFCLIFSPRITNLHVCKMKTSTEYNLKSLDPSQNFVNPFKSLKILKVSLKRI